MDTFQGCDMVSETRYLVGHLGPYLRLEVHRTSKVRNVGDA